MDSQETELYHILIIATVVTAGVLLYAFVTAILQQLQYRQQHNREVGSEILAGENERRWLAADMHDDIGPMLSATKMTLSAIQLKSEEDINLMTESMQRIDEISGKIRTLARGLVPNTLLDKGLTMALEQFTKTIVNVSSLQIELQVQDIPVLSVNTSTHLYRIVQEITHNTLKHAQAKQLVIKMYSRNTELILSAADDGVGFNNSDRKREKKGYGLTGIENRVHLLNGELNIRSKPGTSYFIQIPFSHLNDEITIN